MVSRIAMAAVVLTVVFATVASGARLSSRSSGLSAKRFPGESYKQAAQRNHRSSPRDAAYDLQVPLADLDLQKLPELASVEELEQYFEFVRDGRFLVEESDFPRRCTWLYPDDGCFARAEVAKNELVKKGLVEPMKVFVFGDLAAPTENHPGGVVYWWYHDVIVYRVGEVAYVIDPAINARTPLSLNEWNTAVGGDATTVAYSICVGNTFGPWDDCENPIPYTEDETEATQGYFLPSEWDRQVQLGRNPEAVLGDSPPWLEPKAQLKH